MGGDEYGLLPNPCWIWYERHSFYREVVLQRFIFVVAVSSVFIAVLISGCGKKVCVSGVGDCSIPKPVTPQSSPKLSISAETRQVKAGERCELTVSGAKGKVSWSMAAGRGILDNTYDANKVAFVAPSNVTSATGNLVVHIIVRDEAYKSDSDKDHWAAIDITVVPK